MGIKKYIESPDHLWKLFTDYKKEVKSKPILVHDFVGKDGKDVYRQKEKPLTMVGFECYVCEHTKISYPNISQYFANRDERYTDFVPICSRIKMEIRQDQIQGGMAGIYNPSITQRLNGLVEKSEVTAKVEQPLFGDDDE